MSAALKAQAKALKDWLIDASLPFWEEHGIDRRGGFYEYLNLDRTPNKKAVRRVRVQSRQIFVYAQAARLGWYDGTEVADRTYDFLNRYGYRVDGKSNSSAGYAHLIGPDYAVVDPLRDFYDHAFHLLGAAVLSGLSASKYAIQAREKCTEILGFVDVELEADNEGWLEGKPASLPRRQNPHMHYLEASMALFQVTGDPSHLGPAHQVFSLFERYFYNPSDSGIFEFFDQDWTLFSGERRRRAEPGHAVEWIWLLSQYERLSGISTGKYVADLYDEAFIGNPIFLNDEEGQQGRPRRATKRLWVQTEVIRAHLAMMERGHDNAAANAVRTIEAFREHYLNDDGTWVDQLSEEGRPCAATIPVSTHYHIMGMVMEAARLAKV